MAFPTTANPTTTGITTAADPVTVNLPGSIASGDVLVMIARIAASSINAITGWTKLTANTADGSDDSSEIWYRKSDGTDGATVSVDLVASSKGAFHVWKLTGAGDPTVNPPEFAVATGTTNANADIPALTPTGGALDYTWLVWCGGDSETASFSTPGDDRGGTAGFAGTLVSADSGTGGAVASNVRTASAWTQRNIATENPTHFANPAMNSGVTTFNVAVYPAPAAAVLVLEQGYIDFADPGLLMKARDLAADAWRRKGSILVPRLWTPEGATI